MIIVDKALEERERQGNPIRVGLVGAGDVDAIIDATGEIETGRT